MKTYSINEAFYSLQGEGHRTGTPNVFVRFQACNLQCVDARQLERPLEGNEIDAGFHCDTNFKHGQKMRLQEVVNLVKSLDKGPCKSIIFTGGEPTLQLDSAMVEAFLKEDYYLAVETNGTKPIPLASWVSCSPKPGAPPVISYASEVRCVVKPGQVPEPYGIVADHYFVSPACAAPTADKIEGWESSPSDFNQAAMDWAVAWCKNHPRWRVSLQIHKILGLR